MIVHENEIQLNSFEVIRGLYQEARSLSPQHTTAFVNQLYRQKGRVAAELILRSIEK